MDWKILYRGVDGAERAVTVKCNQLPNLKKAALHLVYHAYGERPPKPLGNLSASAWLRACQLEIIDIVLVDNSVVPQSITFSKPKAYYKRDRDNTEV